MTITAADVHAKISEITSPGGFFEVETRDVDGRPFKVYKHAPPTLVDVLQGARQHGDLEFLVYEGQRLTFKEFFQRVDALAASLQSELALRKGDRVAIAMRNCPDWLVAFSAAVLVGAVVVPINSWGKSEELLYALTDSGAKVLVADDARYKLITDQVQEMPVSLLVSTQTGLAGDTRAKELDSVIKRGTGLSFEPAEAGPGDWCLILYTSGSTGFPKGVLHRHIAVTQALMNMYFLGYLLMELEGQRPLQGGAERETPLLTVPLFHATGLLSGFVVPIQTAQKVVMMYKWDSEKALQLIQDEKVTNLSSVPAILQDLLANPRFEEFDTASLARVAAAGAATPAGLPELIEQKLGAPSRSAGYGMTESMAVGATMSGCIFDMKPHSAGIVSPIMEMRFAGADGNVWTEGEAGEIQLKGITCMLGYWQKPEASAQVFTDDGWMKTGDVGVLDEDGFLHITGRIKEIVIRGGENIYPGEIENVAYKFDAVQEVVVFGVEDPAMGEELAMVCYLRPGTASDEAGLRAFLSERLAGYKVPKYIRFSSEPLPRNASEKLHKLKVKELFVSNALA